DDEDRDEGEELGEAEPAERVQLDRQRIEKDDLDVEEDEQHRGEVEADGEAARLARRPGRDAGLERQQLLPDPRAGPRCEEEREGEHGRRDGGGEEGVDEKRQPVGEHALPFPSRRWLARNLAPGRDLHEGVRKCQFYRESAVTKSVTTAVLTGRLR